MQRVIKIENCNAAMRSSIFILSIILNGYLWKVDCLFHLINQSETSCYQAVEILNDFYQIFSVIHCIWETYAWKQSDRGGKAVELFSVLIQIVKAAL